MTTSMQGNGVGMAANWKPQRRGRRSSLPQSGVVTVAEQDTGQRSAEPWPN